MAITGCILYPQVHLGSIWGLRGHNLAPKWAKMSQNPDMAKGAIFGHFWAGTLTNYIFFTILVHNKSQQVIISQKKLVQAMNRFWWGDQNGPLYHSVSQYRAYWEKCDVMGVLRSLKKGVNIFRKSISRYKLSACVENLNIDIADQRILHQFTVPY